MCHRFMQQKHRSLALCCLSSDHELYEDFCFSSRGVELVGNYHPQCEKDGTYKRTQCHGGMGYCWCVDENGKKINNSLNNC
ncbi:hypothetical protein TNCV_137651 [Trichonephila clavipes]|nr:hypothetical protein TNCV_137651 [Trichonephila clavipes]